MPCEFKQFSFFFASRPQPKARPRARRRGVFLSIYQEISDFEKGLAIHCRLNRKIPKGIECAVSIAIVFCFMRPASIPNGRIWKRSRPDSDNLAKAVLDAMTTAVVWKDDALAVTLGVQKIYVDDEKMEGARVSVNHLEC